MKKYVTPYMEMVTLDTKDIMIVSGGQHNLDDMGTRPTQGQTGWIDEFDSWGN